MNLLCGSEYHLTIVATVPRASKVRSISKLANVDLFEDLPSSTATSLQKLSRVQEVQPGHIFFEPGQTGYGLFILEKGFVQTFRTLGNRKLVITDLKAPAVFGEMGCIGRCQYHCAAQALQPSRVRIIPQREIHSILRRFPEVTRRLLNLVGERFFQVLMELESTSFRGLIARTASLLLQRAEADRVQNVTHKEIAEHLAVYRESATEVLGELKKAGIIRVSRRQIRIVDRVRLERASREQ